LLKLQLLIRKQFTEELRYKVPFADRCASSLTR
jgi:hypothetical protein